MMIESHREQPLTAQSLISSSQSEAAASAVEAERRRIAAMLDEGIVQSLNLILTKAEKYGQMMQDNDQALMAIAALSNLARNALQETRDLQANLNPTTLETLGLEPALEALVAQVSRTTKAHIALVLERLRERLAPQVELALFRTAQDVLEYIACDTAETQATLRLERENDWVVFVFSTPYPDASEEAFGGAAWRAAVLGGQVETSTHPVGGFELKISFPLRASVQLTEREMEVLHLLGEGLTNKEIAERMVVSPRTVNFHLDNIYTKLGVNSRTEAVVYAMRRSWIRRTLANAG
jgi:DNA-binding CsgD family transcriptional regulator